MADVLVVPPLKSTLSRPPSVCSRSARTWGFQVAPLAWYSPCSRAPTRPMSAFFGAKDTSDAESLTESMRVFW